jgi:hypothetical protein
VARLTGYKLNCLAACVVLEKGRHSQMCVSLGFEVGRSSLCLGLQESSALYDVLQAGMHCILQGWTCMICGLVVVELTHRAATCGMAAAHAMPLVAAARAS